MKIVMINGVNHKGSTYQIGRMLADHLAENAEITEYFLPRDLNHFCTGCYQCIEDEQNCPFHEEKCRIEQSMKAADLLIFTTPTYCLRSSSPMKAFMDLFFSLWMSHRPRSYMFRKKAVVISTAAGTGTRTAIKDVTTALSYWGIPEIRTYGISVQAMNWQGVAQKKKAKIEKDMAKLAQKLSAAGDPHVGIGTKGKFYLMRSMQKAGMGSSPEDKQYWEENGWLGKHVHGKLIHGRDRKGLLKNTLNPP